MRPKKKERKPQTNGSSQTAPAQLTLVSRTDMILSLASLTRSLLPHTLMWGSAATETPAGIYWSHQERRHRDDAVERRSVLQHEHEDEDTCRGPAAPPAPPAPDGRRLNTSNSPLPPDLPKSRSQVKSGASASSSGRRACCRQRGAPRPCRVRATLHIWQRLRSAAVVMYNTPTFLRRTVLRAHF